MSIFSSCDDQNAIVIIFVVAHVVWYVPMSMAETMDHSAQAEDGEALKEPCKVMSHM
ncbi:hypothetical protein F4680DRAFT_449773 [Xylaria scruposa]|nr:hypothetical protein F4680DRAFT_449773 [Xylaria scruposa]